MKQLKFSLYLFIKQPFSHHKCLFVWLELDKYQEHSAQAKISRSKKQMYQLWARVSFHLCDKHYLRSCGPASVALYLAARAISVGWPLALIFEPSLAVSKLKRGSEQLCIPCQSCHQISVCGNTKFTYLQNIETNDDNKERTSKTKCSEINSPLKLMQRLCGSRVLGIVQGTSVTAVYKAGLICASLVLLWQVRFEASRLYMEDHTGLKHFIYPNFW